MTRQLTHHQLHEQFLADSERDYEELKARGFTERQARYISTASRHHRIIQYLRMTLAQYEADRQPREPKIVSRGLPVAS